MRRALALLAAVAAALAAAPARAQDPEALDRALRAAMRPAGAGAGAYVLDTTADRRLFRLRERRARIIASNAKLFTTAAALGRLGAGATIPTSALAAGRVGPDGTLSGDLYLRGGGDPAFGTAAYAGRRFGSPATIEALADRLADTLGIVEVSGRVVGDESAFDSYRGGPDSRFGPSPWHGQLSALAVDEARGLRGQSPPLRAASLLDDALEARGVRVRSAPRAGTTPAAAAPLASVSSLPVDRLVRITNKASSNFFAEMLLKRLAVDAGGQGTTARGADLAESHARALGARVRLADGSGLSRANRAAPREVVDLLDAMRGRPELHAFEASLPVAGVDGTLAKRMRRGPARRRCRAKTGTLSGVSALSGYCRARSGHVIAFSVLANGVRTTAMKRLEDRMAAAIVRYG